jgi:LGFP repeat
MHASPRLRRGLRLGLVTLTLALNAAVVLVPGQAAQAQSGGSCGPEDYPIPGGWFYTQEAHQWACITSQGPSRSPGYTVVDDAEASFWTEFRRYGGVDVLGYPVSQRYHYPVGNPGGYVYQAFERGILQWHPQTQQAELANVFDQFSENGLDDELAKFGIPRPQDVGPDPEQHMALLAEPQFVSRFFYDPVGFHSSEPDRAGQSAFRTQEQAWTFFGLPQSSAQRLVLGAHGELFPLTHNFYAQRFQKAGLQLFVQEDSESYLQPIAVDPTIVPGDGIPGCVVQTATGLLARTIGAGKLIPLEQIKPQPLVSLLPHYTTFVPQLANGQNRTSFEVSGTGFQANEPITISFTHGLEPDGKTSIAPPLPVHAGAGADGSFSVVADRIRVGSWTVTATGDKSSLSFSDTVDLTIPTRPLMRTSTSCTTPVGLPTWN